MPSWRRWSVERTLSAGWLRGPLTFALGALRIGVNVEHVPVERPVAAGAELEADRVVNASSAMAARSLMSGSCPTRLRDRAGLLV